MVYQPWVPSQRVVYSADMYERNEFTIPQFKEDTNFVGVREILNEMVALDPLYAINIRGDGNSLDALKIKVVMMNELYDVVNARFQEAFASDDGLKLGSWPLIAVARSTAALWARSCHSQLGFTQPLLRTSSKLPNWGYCGGSYPSKAPILGGAHFEAEHIGN
ncbi:hypothetical protein [Cochlodiniinecator piscidefendens]|uniref:hypothetical protein n=1 Tax=Cochlodiniinecator piscidefendens TaxID=2715756 RepID=UPI00140D2CF8|nr:hypothetical protein [Cochlodiniinecator piscidefendens]